jgi:fermentation-respiration switch protein FrsA (DUF1100 family)
MLYYPSRNLFVQDVNKLTPVPNDIFFESAKGDVLHAWHFTSRSQEKPRATIVFFHGNAQNLSAHFFSLYWLLDEPYEVFIFDYPGYGRSSGKPSPEGTVEAGKAAMKWVKRQFPDRPIVVFAQSIGGPIALRTLEELGPDSGAKLLVLDSTFSSYRQAATGVLSHFWFTWPLQWMGHVLISDAWAPDRKKLAQLCFIKSFLVIHADRDPAIGYSLGQDLFEALPAPKTLWVVPAKSHIGSFFGFEGKYRRDFSTWLSSSL